MAKKQKQPTKTCSDCIHENACRIWTDGRSISDASASACPNHETVKESASYLCGVLDERKRKQTNADRIRAMSDEELGKYLCWLAGCHDCEGRSLCEHPDFKSGDGYTKWLKQPAE